MKNADILSFLVNLEYEVGPSIDYSSKLFQISIDIVKLNTSLYVNWPASDKNFMEFYFVDNIDADFEVAITFFNIFTCSFTRMPLIGPIIKKIAIYKMATLKLTLPLPNPQDVPLPANNPSNL